VDFPEQNCSLEEGGKQEKCQYSGNWGRNPGKRPSTPPGEKLKDLGEKGKGLTDLTPASEHRDRASLPLKEKFARVDERGRERYIRLESAWDAKARKEKKGSERRRATTKKEMEKIYD